MGEEAVTMDISPSASPGWSAGKSLDSSVPAQAISSSAWSCSDCDRFDDHSKLPESLRCILELGHTLRTAGCIQSHRIGMDRPGLVRTRFDLAKQRDRPLEIDEGCIPISVRHARDHNGTVKPNSRLARA